MRGAICCLLAAGLLLPSVGICARGVGALCPDSGLIVKGSGGDSSGLEMASDDGFWTEVVRVVYTSVRNGVIYESVKYIVRKVKEVPPSVLEPPPTEPGWWPGRI